jgi:hypothetical protein
LGRKGGKNVKNLNKKKNPGSEAHRIWWRLQTITDYKGFPSRELPSNAGLPDELNTFYARFEASNTEPSVRAQAVPDNCVITPSIANMSKTFEQVDSQTDYQDGYSQHDLTS